MAPGTKEADLLRQWEPLAQRLASRFARIADREDLEQVARLGLLQAARRFDPMRGFSFHTFAVPTISGMLARFLRDEAAGRGVPRRWLDLRPHLLRTREALSWKLGRDPSLEELASELGVSEEDAQGALVARDLCYPGSLDEQADPGQQEQDARLSERLGDLDPLLRTAETRLAVRSALDALPARLREIVCRRYLDGCSQRRVARALGISQQQVCRLEREALRLLRETIGDVL